MARKPNLVAFAERREHVVATVTSAYDEARLTVAQAAVELGVSEHTIRRAYVGGHLKVQRFGLGGRALRIVRRDLRAWAESGGNTATPPGRPR